MANNKITSVRTYITKTVPASVSVTDFSNSNTEQLNTIVKTIVNYFVAVATVAFV